MKLIEPGETVPPLPPGRDPIRQLLAIPAAGVALIGLGGWLAFLGIPSWQAFVWLKTGWWPH